MFPEAGTFDSLDEPFSLARSMQAARGMQSSTHSLAQSSSVELDIGTVEYSYCTRLPVPTTEIQISTGKTSVDECAKFTSDQAFRASV